MGQGQSNPVGSVGFSGEGGFTGATSVAGSGASPGGGGGLGALLGDPEVLKALGGFASQIAGVMKAGQKIPPHAKQMLAQLIHGGQQGPQQSQEMSQGDSLNPYGGDMGKFITPEMARGVLDQMGIPYGRIRPIR
jgi:hypothetical protein